VKRGAGSRRGSVGPPHNTGLEIPPPPRCRFHSSLHDRTVTPTPFPSEFAGSVLEDYWDDVVKIKDRPDDTAAPYKSEKNMDEYRRMQLNFYSNDEGRNLTALEFYKTHKVGFMLEKARKTWKGALRDKAEIYLKELERSATAQ